MSTTTDRLRAAGEHFRYDLTRAGFTLQSERAPLEQWAGTVEVDWDDPDSGTRQHASHPVVVTLGPGFPYEKPGVYPRDDPPIAHQRHQSPAGDGAALCLWPEDASGWLPSDDVARLLERVRQWFIHYHQDDWPPEDRPPDLHLYFNNPSRSPIMMINQQWAPPADAKTGRFRVRRDSKRPERAIAEAAAGGATTAQSATNSRVSALLGLNDIKPTSGVWYRLPREPDIEPTLGPLLTAIDHAANEDEGWALSHLVGLLGRKVDPRRSAAVLALGYPDVAGQEQWLFLEVNVAAGSSAGLVKWTSATSLEKIPIYSFETASIAPDALLRRTGHTAKQLNGKRILVFGLGALGSVVALLLAKSGVPQLHLVDSDVLRPGNTVRHEAGLYAVGINKAQAVMSEIHQHAPDCTVLFDDKTWNPTTLVAWIRSADIVIDATANEAFSLLLNELCVQAQTPVIFATAHRRATIGRIRIVRPGQDACLVCHMYGYRCDDPLYPFIPISDEGSFLEEGCGVPTIEASAVDITETASWASRAALWHLQGKLGQRNHCLVVNEPIPDAQEPLDEIGVHWSFWPPIPLCECCAGVSSSG